jgi:3-oxoacyl-(acyl-carrier-protein) synthase/NADPH:quinone reductase-like Zn-dependent oxidoreductase/short-subunit dehydrogenase/acyl carrier protein
MNIDWREGQKNPIGMYVTFYCIKIPSHATNINLTEICSLYVQRCRYVGVMHMEYIQFLHREGVKIQPSITTGNGMDFMIGRLSFVFSLTGPCVSTHTACSSSLVSLHLGRTSLLCQEASHSVASGVFTVLFSDSMNAIGNLNAFSADGRCKTFSSVADGYGRGEGVAAFALSREENPEEIAIVSGSSVCHSGRSSGLTAPNGPSQATLIQKTMQESLVSADDIISTSLHGTGTALGDPIELGGLISGYSSAKRRHYNVLSSSKASLGHAEGNAGLTGSIFALRALRTLSTASILHMNNLNIHISRLLEDRAGDSSTNFVLPREHGGLPISSIRYAATSSFGMSGVNAHAIFFNSPKEDKTKPRRPYLQKKGYWITPLHKKIVREVSSCGTKSIAFVLSNANRMPNLFDHKVNGQAILPGTGVLEIYQSSINLSLESLDHETCSTSICIISPINLSKLQSEAFESHLDLTNGGFEIVNSGNQYCHGQTSLLSVERLSNLVMERKQIIHERFSNIRSNIGLSNLIDKCKAADSAKEAYSINIYRADASMHVAACLSDSSAVGIPVEFNNVSKRLANFIHQPECSTVLESSILRTIQHGLSMPEIRLKALPTQSRKKQGNQIPEVQFTYRVHDEVSIPLDVEKPVDHSEFEHIILPVKSKQKSLQEDALQEMQRFQVLLRLQMKSLKIRLPYDGDDAPSKSCVEDQSLSLGVIHAMAKAIAAESGSALDVSLCDLKNTDLHPVAGQEESMQYGRRLSSFVVRESFLQKQAQMIVPSFGSLHVSPADGMEFRMHDSTPYDYSLRVHAVALNFRDLMIALGMYPREDQPFVSDCSGILTCAPIGSDLKAGDRVFGLVPGCVGREVKVENPEMLCICPGNVSLEEGSSLPTVYCTALLCMKGAKRGDKVLVHAAAGGLGMAIIDVANAMGCFPRGTASTSAKRGVLRQNYGCKTMSSSRNTSFVDDIGLVDVVVNSLTSPGMVAASLAILQPGGRFLEVGKRNIWSQHKASQERPDVHLNTVALDFMPPAAIGSLLRKISTSISKGSLTIPRRTSFTFTKIKNALKMYSIAMNIGKIVITGPDDDPSQASEASWAITGGAGALGQITTQYLLSKGVKSVHLLSRHSKSLSEVIMNSSNLLMHSICDLSSLEDWTRLRAIEISGLIHSAGISYDGAIASQSPQTIRKVLAPKLSLIDKTSSHLPDLIALRAIVMYSSVASMIGSAGQVNYAMANGALDVLAVKSQVMGISATAIQWGAWSKGMADTEAVRKAAAKTGIGFLEPHEAMNNMQAALLDSVNFSNPLFAIFKMDWSTMLKLVDKTPYMLHAVGSSVERGHASDTTSIAGSVPRRHLMVYSFEQIETVVLDHVNSISGTAIDVETPLMDGGIDSLGTVELQNALAQDFSINLDATVIFDYPSVRALSQYLFSILNPVESRIVQVNTAGDAASGTRVSTSLVSIHQIRDRPLEMDDLKLPGSDQAIRTPISRWDSVWSDGDTYYNKFGMYLDGIFAFDRHLFRISNSEAMSMDPQHRLLLEVAFEIHNAAAVSDNTSVMTGIGTSDYLYHIGSSTPDAFFASGCANSVASGRISFLFNLQGPAVTVDTACSSSMVATHYSCVDISQSAIEGSIILGVNAILNGQKSMLFSLSGMLSADGRCKTLDASANGYVRSESCSAMYASPYSGSDTHCACILGSAVNQDGRSGGLTAPNGPAQIRVIQSALKNAEVDRYIFQIALHGTGTELGDPIEVGSVLKICQNSLVAMSAVKSSIGHSETGAGLSNIVSAVYQCTNNIMSHFVHLRSLNKHIISLKQPTRASFMPMQSCPRRLQEMEIGCSAFAFQVTLKT